MAHRNFKTSERLVTLAQVSMASDQDWLVNDWCLAGERLVNGFYFSGHPNEIFSGFMVVLGRGWVILTSPMLKKMDFKYFWLKFLRKYIYGQENCQLSVGPMSQSEEAFPHVAWS